MPEAGNPAHARGAVIATWNAMQHFHPYVDELAWDTSLARALDDAADDHVLEDTQRTLERMLASLGDGQLVVDGPLDWAVVPARFARIEGKVLVVEAKPELGLRRGDELMAVDGVATDDALARAQERVGGTAQQREWLLLGGAGITRGNDDQAAKLTLRRDDQLLELELERVSHWQGLPSMNPAIQRFEDGVMYVDLSEASWNQLQPRLRELAGAPGVVLDLRGEARWNSDLLGHLLSEPDEVDRDFAPQIIRPDHETPGWRGSHESWAPAKPHIAAPLVFIADASSSATYEDMLASIVDHELGDIVGSPTGGANGRVARFDVPGGLELVYTCGLTKRRDGSPLHVGGVTPTVTVEPSAEAFDAGRDELLEVALANVRNSER